MKHEANMPVDQDKQYRVAQDTSRYMIYALTLPGSALLPLPTVGLLPAVSPGLGWPYQT